MKPRPPSMFYVKLDQCQYGARWRKRTGVLLLHAPCSTLDCRCSGRGGRCSRSGSYHIPLAGVDPVSKRLWTQLAQPYPRAFARAAAEALRGAALARRSARLHQLVIANATEGVF